MTSRRVSAEPKRTESFRSPARDRGTETIAEKRGIPMVAPVLPPHTQTVIDVDSPRSEISSDPSHEAIHPLPPPRISQLPELISPKTSSHSLTNSTSNASPSILNPFLSAKRALDQKRRDKATANRNMIICTLGLAGVILMIIELEVSFDPVQKIYYSSATSEALKIAISVVTFVLLVAICEYYRFQSMFERKEWQLEGRGCLRSDVTWKLLLELLVCIIHAPPYIPAFYDRIGLFMYMRLYLGVRLFRDFSSVYRYRGRIQQKNALDGRAPMTFDWVLTFKTAFYRKPTVVMICATLASVVVVAHAILITERSYHVDGYDFGNYGTSVWFVIVTMATVGYGDITAKTPTGRVVTAVAILLGLVIASLLVAALTTQLKMSNNQRAAADWLEERALDKELRDTATRIIQISWRGHRQQTASLAGARRMREGINQRMIPLIKALRKLRERTTDRGDDDNSMLMTVNDIQRRLKEDQTTQGESARAVISTRLTALEQNQSKILAAINRMEQNIESIAARLKVPLAPGSATL